MFLMFLHGMTITTLSDWVSVVVGHQFIEVVWNSDVWWWKHEKTTYFPAGVRPVPQRKDTNKSVLFAGACYVSNIFHQQLCMYVCMHTKKSPFIVSSACHRGWTQSCDVKSSQPWAQVNQMWHCGTEAVGNRGGGRLMLHLVIQEGWWM